MTIPRPLPRSIKSIAILQRYVRVYQICLGSRKGPQTERTQAEITYERDITMVQRPSQEGQTQSQRQRYIVGNAPPQMLSTLVEQCRIDPEIDLINVLGPADQPRLLVIETTAERAEQLK